MTRVIVTALADRDLAAILGGITGEAGYAVAEKYSGRFESLYNFVADHPKSCPSRPQLGPSMRIGVVPPYLVIYRHSAGNDTVAIIRVLHGRRRLNRQILRSG